MKNLEAEARHEAAAMINQMREEAKAKAEEALYHARDRRSLELAPVKYGNSFHRAGRGRRENTLTGSQACPGATRRFSIGSS